MVISYFLSGRGPWVKAAVSGPRVPTGPKVPTGEPGNPAGAGSRRDDGSRADGPSDGGDPRATVWTMTSGTADQGDQFDLVTVNEVVSAAVPTARRSSSATVARPTASWPSGAAVWPLTCTARGDRLPHRTRRVAPHESGSGTTWRCTSTTATRYLEGVPGCAKARAVSFNVNYRYVAEGARSTCSTTLPARGRDLPRPASPPPSPSCSSRWSPRSAVASGCCSRSTTAPARRSWTELRTTRPRSSGPDPAGPGLTRRPTTSTSSTPAGRPGCPGRAVAPDDIFMNAMGGKGGRHRVEMTSAMTRSPIGPQQRRFRPLALPPLMHGGCAVGGVHDVELAPRSSCQSRRSTRRGLASGRDEVQSIALVGDAMARPLLDELVAGDYDTSSLFVLGNGGAVFSATLKAEFEGAARPADQRLAGVPETGAQASTLSARAACGPPSSNPDRARRW